MSPILSTDYYVHFQENAFAALHEYLNSNFHSKMFLLVDSNTKRDCLPYFQKRLNEVYQFEVIEIEAGEIYKNLETCTHVWNALTNKGADRKSLLINLGGGVITDMGGFVASTFKRGIKFINIPTTLLSMVDASVGGKTGIDLGVLKNQIGMFSNPEMVLIDTHFLKSVTEREMRSGMAEIIKYGLTFDKQIWNQIRFSDDKDTIMNALVHRSVEIKNNVVLKDLKENNIRKILNFGHTMGHSIESYFLESEHKNNLTHGEAIAIGMAVELYFSSVLFGFPLKETEIFKDFCHKYFGKTLILKEDFEPIIQLLIYDKKNVNGIVNFILLEDFERCKIDVQVKQELLIEGLNYYLN